MITEKKKRTNIVITFSLFAVIRAGIVLLTGLVFYLSSQRRHSGETGYNLRYKTWFNYVATMNRDSQTTWNDMDQQTASHGTSTGQGKWPKYLCYQFQAGLGNQMFAFAFSYGIAKEKHRILVTKSNLLPLFTLKANRSVVERRNVDKICSNRQVIIVNQQKKKNLNLGDDSVVILNGFLYSWKYFKNVETELREMFTFRTDILIKAQKILHEIKEKHFRNRLIPMDVTFVGMYVQRSSIINPLKDSIVAPRSYFFKAMIFFQSKFRHVIFVLVTDSLTWCRKNLSDKIHIINTNSSADLDMSILSQCNHTITSGGTFGWWAAWLANGTTTYFVPSLKTNSNLKTVVDTTYSNFFWPGWIPITNNNYVSVNISNKRNKSNNLLNKIKDYFRL